MHFKIFTLLPQLFDSFLNTSLIARGISQNVIKIDTINWREEFGLCSYKQVDDKPFGGGSGMVLMVEPISSALQKYTTINTVNYSDLSDKKQILKNVVLNSYFDFDSELFPEVNDLKNDFIPTDANQQISISDSNISKKSFSFFPKKPIEFVPIFPNNSVFEQYQKRAKPKQVNISLTPRGFPLNQQICEWLATDFEQINLLCGRYEGFDARVSSMVDLEISVGNFVTNGGEVPAMCLVEAVSRLIPNFVTKNSSVLHDSFSSGLNIYTEQKEMILGKKKLEQNPNLSIDQINSNIKNHNKKQLFDNFWWQQNILPYIEHPQYTRPEVWQNLTIPEVLKGGHHKQIQTWREKGWKE